MYQIAQGDIFRYLNQKSGDKRIYHTQKDIATAVGKAFYITIDKSGINRISKGKAKGRKEFGMERIDAFFDELFPDIKQNSEAGKVMLSNAKEFVRKNELYFVDWEGSPNDTFETYMKRMFRCGLPNRQLHLPAPDPSKSISAPPEQKITLYKDNLALDRIDCFTGRENLLSDLQSRLEQYGIAVLTGMGGIGKSALAKEFAIRNCSRYPSIQIVSSEFQNKFESVVLAIRFDELKDENETPQERYQRRLKLLQRLNDQTLIIIDNADLAWQDIQQFYDSQRTMKFHLIITSRLNDGFRKPFCLPVTALSHDEQRKLFLDHCGEIPKDSESLILDEILHHIEGHTLLIELIAKTMYYESASFSEMLEWLHDKNTDHRFMENGELKSVKKVIHNVLFRSKLDEEQQNLLFQLTFLPVDGISRKLFLRRLCRNADSLNLLESRSWVIREVDRIRIHPVIRDTVRDNMSLDCRTYSEFLRSLQAAMEQPFESLNEDDQISLCQLARGIGESLVGSIIPLEIWDCLYAIAGYCKASCQYQTALLVYELLCSVEENADDRNKRVELHLEIGRLYQRLADYNKAIGHYQKALAMTLQDDDQRGSCYNSLAVIYRKNAEYEKALEYFKAALRCYTRDDLIATAKNDLGVVYMNLGSRKADPEESRADYQKAKECYEDSLMLREKLGAGPRDLAFSHHNIGSALYRLGLYKQALEEHTKALNLRRDNHLQKPDIAASLNWIGNDLMGLGKMPEAKDRLDKSLNIRKQILGERHPDLAWVLISLSQWYEKMGDLPHAIQFMQEAYDIRNEQLRPDHPYTIEARERLNKLTNNIASV